MAETVNTAHTKHISVSHPLLSPLAVLGLLGCILAGHIVATFLGLYWNMQALIAGLHIDKIFHIAGGIWIAMLFFYYAVRIPRLGITAMHPLVIFLTALGAVALIGVLWEFFEFGLDHYFGSKPLYLKQQGGLTDTMGDLAADLVGGLAAAVLYIRVLRTRLPVRRASV